MENLDNIIFESESELMHYGVLGMKWGQHKRSRELNKLDKESTKHIGQAIKYEHKANSITKNAMKRVNKRGGMDKLTVHDKKVLSKQNRKVNEATAKANAHRESARKADSKTWRKMAEFVESGYSVRGKEVLRYRDSGKAIAATALGGPLAGLAVRSAEAIRYKNEFVTNFKGGRVSQTPSMVVGNKWRVTKNK